MNNRIKELYNEAAGHGLSVDDFVLHPWEQKFAELIVKECVSIVEKDAPISAMYVKEHFGVK